MASITIQIPDAVAQEVVDLLCADWGYQAQIPAPTQTDPTATTPNPQTKGQFIKAQIALWLKERVVAAKAVKAALEAEATARASAESAYNIT